MRTRLHLTASTLLSVLTLVSATGCGSSATTSTATSPSSINRCAVTVNGSGQVPAQGGAGSLAVSAARECIWAASAEGQWLTIKTGTNGQGDGSIEYNATANPDPAVRRGAIVLNEQRVEVTQAAGECVYSLSEASGNFPQAGGAGQFEVRASSSLCSWTAQSDAPWVSVRAAASRQGTATVQFDVSRGHGTATYRDDHRGGSSLHRSAGSRRHAACASHAAGPTYPSAPPTHPSAPATHPSAATYPSAVTYPPTCTFSLAPEVQNVDARERDFNVDVNTSSGCGWTAASNAPWITLRETSGNGAGRVRVTAAANPGPARSGTATIAGRTLTVNQAVAPCSYKVSPHEVKVDEDRQVARIEVETASTCSWTAVSNTQWISVVFNASGTGSGEVWISISENDGKKSQGNGHRRRADRRSRAEGQVTNYLMSMSSMSNTSMPCGLSGWPS